MTEESGGDRQKECHSVTSDSRGMADEYCRTSGYECPAGAGLGCGCLKLCQMVAVNDEVTLACGWQRIPNEAVRLDFATKSADGIAFATKDGDELKSAAEYADGDRGDGREREDGRGCEAEPSEETEAHESYVNLKYEACGGPESTGDKGLKGKGDDGVECRRTYEGDEWTRYQWRALGAASRAAKAETKRGDGAGDQVGPQVEEGA
ncbi:hypothetical protein GN958_ATG20421 [Phytophthora infestans]|uniref:Uncharacterized protein n=1 Tax=Phytophthora infestans TaxID=4787 RepID=A0A8S9TV06_PHYIN|nr:hypothetical protein GN958_ATG20421 [Phytophthora infestans]